MVPCIYRYVMESHNRYTPASAEIESMDELRPGLAQAEQQMEIAMDAGNPWTYFAWKLLKEELESKLDE